MPYGSTYSDARTAGTYDSAGGSGGTFNSAGNIQSTLANMTQVGYQPYPQRPHRSRPNYNTVKVKKPFTCANKHPVMALKELCPAATFETACSYHVPGGAAVVMSCIVNGVTYQGEGTDSKIAKAIAAHKALAGIKANEFDLVKKVCDYTEQRQLVLTRISKWQDDQAKKAAIKEEAEKREEKQQQEKLERAEKRKLAKAESDQQAFLTKQAREMEKENKKAAGAGAAGDQAMEVGEGDQDAVVKKLKNNNGAASATQTHNPNNYGSLLHRYGPEVSESSAVLDPKGNGGCTPLFKSTLTVQGFSFEATATTKKGARNAAVLAAFEQFEVNPPPIVNIKRKKVAEKRQKKKRPQPGEEGYVERAAFVPPPATEFPDMIAELSWKVFDEILADVPEMFRARRNVVAIVKVEGESVIDNCEVVALGSGTLCMFMDKMDGSGELVEDLTGDSLALRGFRAYLVGQVKKHLEGSGEDSIFCNSGKNLQVKEGISFILYSNSSPMGDCRIVQKEDPNAKDSFKSRKQGLLPVNEEDLGKFRFFRTDKRFGSSESCFTDTSSFLHCIPSPSDKLGIRQICGVQGSLLSSILEPIFISRHIINRSFNEASLQRALYDRFKEVSAPEGCQLPPAPALTHTLWRGTFGTPPCIPWGIIWAHDQGMELLHTPTGKRLMEWEGIVPPEVPEEKLGVSSYATKSLFSSLQATCRKHKMSCEETYSAQKTSDTPYRKMKNAVISFAKESELGEWPIKPIQPDF